MSNPGIAQGNPGGEDPYPRATPSSRRDAGNVIALTSPTTPYEGDQLTFHWTTDAPDRQELDRHLRRRPAARHRLLAGLGVHPAAPPATLTLDTSGLTGGPYTAYLLAKDGYGILARTAPFSFAAQPGHPAPHAVVDALTAPRSRRRGRSRPLGGLWIRPQGNPAGNATFSRLGGALLAVGRRRRHRDRHRPRLRPAAPPGHWWSACRTARPARDTITVQVPVRSPMDRVQLKIATLNLWDAGSHVDDPLEKQLRVVLTQGLDVVALQETGGTAARALAEALGW